MKYPKLFIITSIISVIFLFIIGQVIAATAPTLGMVNSFAVLANSAITNTGPSVIVGDIGISPGTASSVTGFFPAGSYSGALHAADAVSLQAQTDATTVFNSLNSQPCNFNLTGQDLGLHDDVILPALVPGVYCFDSSAQLTGNLVLNAQGDPNAVWIFRMGSTLTTAPGSSVTYINSSSELCYIFWQVGSSAIIDTTTVFRGNIFTVASITLNTSASLVGRAVALGGAVTLDTNAISFPSCIFPPVPTATTGPAPTSGPAQTTDPGSGQQIVPDLPETGSGMFILDEMTIWGLLLFGGMLTSAVVFGARSLRRSDQLKK